MFTEKMSRDRGIVTQPALQIEPEHYYRIVLSPGRYEIQKDP